MNTNETKCTIARSPRVYPYNPFIAIDPLSFAMNMLVDQPKITRRATKIDLQEAHYYALMQDVDGDMPYDEEMISKMAGWLNMNNIDVNFTQIRKFIKG